MLGMCPRTDAAASGTHERVHVTSTIELPQTPTLSAGLAITLPGHNVHSPEAEASHLDGRDYT
ncbi:hypothetical protein GCM10027597_23720 [Saccharopolyspora tripterygii]